MADSPVPVPSPPAAAQAASAPGSEADIKRRLELSRRELLDLTARNRLLHTPRKASRSSSVEIVGEKSVYVHQLLVIDGKAMTFEAALEESLREGSKVEPSGKGMLNVASVDDESTKADDRGERVSEGEAATSAPIAAPLPEASVDAIANTSPTAISDVDGDPLALDAPFAAAPDTMAQPVEDDNPEVIKRQRDDRLQTVLASAQLQQRLLRTYYAARTFEEEQGVNVLFLALGFLKWFEPDKPAKERFAPLLLIPVELERQSVAARFRIRWSGEDIHTNLSLQVKLRADFRIDLPSVEKALDESEEISTKKYFDLVRAAIDGNKGWQVFDDDIVLGFFSFAKLLMYRDLEPTAWPDERALHKHALMAGLLGTKAGAALNAPVADDDAGVSEDALIDPLIEPRDMMHVVDADSSQAIVVEEAKRGRSLVIQGPPGTGKSQTISNIIAAAVKANKRVLFVAEKVAALNVVKDRLTNIGLGDMCLALHSNKARKASVLEDIGRTLSLDKPVVKDADQIAGQLKEARDRLNQHALAMHTPLPPSDVTAWQCVGELVRLRAAGVPTSDFTIETCHTWSAEQTQQRRAMLRELAAYAGEIGVPAQHPWRGVMIDGILPMDLDRVRTRFEPASTLVRAAQESAIALARSLNQAPDAAAITLASARGNAAAAERIATAPPMDRAALADRVWESQRAEIVQVVAVGKQMMETRARFASTLTGAAWNTDFADARRDMAALGDGLFRFLSSAYRNAKNALKGVLAAGAALPKSLADRLALMDAVIATQAAQKSIAASNEVGRRAFGQSWLAEKSDWNALAAIDAWERECASDPRMPKDFRQIASRIIDAKPLADAARNVQAACDREESASKEVLAAFNLDANVAFALIGDAASPSEHRIPFAALAERFDAWRAAPEGVTKWIAYRTRDAAARGADLTELCNRLREGLITPAQTIDRFDAAYFERILRQLSRVHPSLTSFDGLAHDRLQQQFRDLDQHRINLARAEVALAHWERIPRGQSIIGEVGVIRRELAKKRRHLPIRQLLRNAGNAVQAVKPVFMMSPLSIAQYIEPGALEFDILLIDEASQVRPVDALGAIARAKQIIVVGDDKQLPPTRFFTRELEGEAMEDDDEASMTGTSDLESILGLCGSLDLPQRMLRWHYRSRHHSLIAVSNREFYESRLYVVPSPHERDATRGLVFHHIANGIFDRGGTATNRIEAMAVANAVMQHAKQWPKLSLGIGAFSVQQRDAIIDEVERLRRADPSCESFFATDVAEPFFVKNLENIQGDERDVIFISVGYARDAKGGLTMNFGPLSNAGGERRLNVLITRAKSRCEVFSCITADDINLERATGKGPSAFKAFLAYAQKGVLEGAAAGTGDDAMENVLSQSLRSGGWQVDQHVGVGGFFVDLAVRKPDAPAGEYILGVECDGPGYAAARSARDRDRTQPFVLTDRGWKLHRVWSLDFFNRPDEQIQKMLGAIGSQSPAKSARAESVDRTAGAAMLRREDASDRRTAANNADAISVPYVEARFRVPSTREIPDVAVGKMSEIVAKIIEIEGPIHSDEIAERVRQLWEAARLGPRMLRAIDAAIEWAVRTNIAYREGDFCRASAQSPIAVRDRSEVESASLRDAAMLPPMEIDLCVTRIIRANFGATREETITAAARTLGFKSTTPALRQTIDARIADMLKATTIVEENGRLRCRE